MESLKTYEGNFIDNTPSGQGKLTIPGELVYEGLFTPTDGQFHIEGKMTYPDGRVVEGSWGGVNQE